MIIYVDKDLTKTRRGRDEQVTLERFGTEKITPHRVITELDVSCILI